MSGREVRGRPGMRDRLDEKPQHGKGNNPPSRHLWVGNISHKLTESDLAHYFLRYGELESVAFQPGRSYAFVNYINEGEAIDAIKELNGFTIEGNPLRIEFAKAEKSSVPSHNDFSRRVEPHPVARDSPFNQRDPRSRQYTPDAPNINKSKTNSKDSEPSNILWIGFPAELKVDEFILRKAFSPFGEIEKITAFPGRTYAFVRYRNVRSADRAKEMLQGKLFGNPRVHICFSNGESKGSNRERISINSSASPRGPYRASISPEHVRPHRDRNRPPPYIPSTETDDRRRVMDLTGMDDFHSTNDYHEQRGFPVNMYERSISPERETRARFHEISPREFPRQGSSYNDDTWDMPEDVSFLRENKKMKSDTFPPDNDLPEFPLSELGRTKQVMPRETPQNVFFNRNFDSSGHGTVHEHLVPKQTFAERDDNWNLKTDNFQVGLSHLPPPPPFPDRAREAAAPKEVWEWEGMIAKVGTPVCRARCFPVGKSMDMALPNYIDCTAKTSLDMLAKHYYQASSVWVVFFVPANDPDIAYYNEFMNYLGEKQRAAVSKLDEKTTLFLVPPSEFSENVLKVHGKLSISGVVLRLDNQGPSHGPLYENKEASLTSFQNAAPYQKPISPPQPYLPTPIYRQYDKPVTNVVPNASSRDYVQKPPPGAIWSNHDMQNSGLGRNFPSHTPGSSITSVNPTYSEQLQEQPRNSYAPEPPRNSYAPEPPRNSYAPEPPRNNYAPEPPRNNYPPGPSRNNYPPDPPRNNYPPGPPHNNYTPTPEPPHNNYAPTPEPPRNSYAPEPPRNNYTPTPEPPRNNYAPEPPRNNYAPEPPRSNNYTPEPPRNSYASEMPGGALGGNGNNSAPLQNPIAGIQADQLAQLASSLLGKNNHFTGMSSTNVEYVPLMNTSQPGYSSSVTPQNYGLPHNGQTSSEYTLPSYSQAQAQPMQQIAAQAVGPMNQNVGEEEEEDPQKRLQATLQLAAALLHQIKSGKGNEQ